jgi:glyoxylase-like metal-dependent hydrolase (beta-lactamase superfamily II)
MTDSAELAAGVHRVVAPNPSVMTGPGTNTYLVGNDEIAVIDPGPLIMQHLSAIRERATGDIRWVVVTHTHPDHSPGAAELAAQTGAALVGMAPPDGPHQDATFVPDRAIADGDRIEGADFVLEAVHTPGHASNHVCYRHLGHNWLFTGDHVISGSTVVINPPDGDMAAYIDSLRRVRALGCTTHAPGHGGLIRDPGRVVDWIIEHRLARESKVKAAVREHAGATARELVAHVYRDVDPGLYGWAERSLLAHLEKLESERQVVADDGCWRLI